MPTYTSLSLLDIPGLQGLGEICDTFNVRITAHGGIVRRLARVLPEQGPWDPTGVDLFALVPFGSDIDLIHDGDDSATETIRDALHRHVPNAECFRWDLQSQVSRASLEEATRVNNVIPSASMRLSTLQGSGIWDPWDGWQDVHKRTYRYIRNGYYKSSPKYLAGQDIELLSVLIYSTAVLEADLTADIIANQPGMPAANAVLEDAVGTETTIIALQESAYLRVRLLYLFTNMVAAARSPTALQAVLERIGFDRFLSYLADYRSPLHATITSLATVTENTVIFTSAWLGGDLFRLPPTTSQWVNDNAQAEFDAALQHEACFQGRAATAALGEHQAIVLASPRIPLQSGVALSSRGAGVPFVPGEEANLREFVAARLVLPAVLSRTLLEYGEENLSAALVIHGADEAGSVAVVGATSLLCLVPSVCLLQAEGASGAGDPALYLRCNCLGFLEYAQRIIDRLVGPGRDPYVQFFLLGWRDPA